MRSHLDQLQVNTHYTLKIMSLLLNSAKYCWFNYFCAVLLHCGIDPNVIPTLPGSNPRPLHIRPQDPNSLIQLWPVSVCFWFNIQWSVQWNSNIVLVVSGLQQRLVLISCTMQVLHRFLLCILYTFKFYIPECLYATLFLHFGFWYFWSHYIILILSSWYICCITCKQPCMQIK